MPYRRLPRTDEARLNALKSTLDIEQLDFDKMPTSFKLINQAKTILPKFENLVQQYRMANETKMVESRKGRNTVKMCRMYLSHFIQILNFAEQRKELKSPQKELYGLRPGDYTLPDLNSEQALYEWGQKIINGERTRVSHGGIALQNPTIQRVAVYYEGFKEYYVMQLNRRQNTQRALKNVKVMRPEVDEIILQVWDEVELYYADLLPYARYQKCLAAGVVYYYRKFEQPLTQKVDDGILLNERITLSIPFEKDGDYDKDHDKEA